MRGPNTSGRGTSHPLISQRDWVTEKEAAAMTGWGHSTLRGWRYEEERRRKAGLPSRDLVPRYYRQRRQIRYLKSEVYAWIERHSSPSSHISPE